MRPEDDEVHVLVTFYSRGGLTERLAVLIAEGAIQGGAIIRLRRARDTEPEDVVASVPGWRENRDRMHAEYAEPRIADVDWADAIAFGTPATRDVGPELGAFLEQTKSAGGLGKLSHKVASAFTSTYVAGALRDAAVESLSAQLLRMGYIVAPAPANGLVQDYECAREHGRCFAYLARALRTYQA